jgi:hypothetical protein
MTGSEKRPEKFISIDPIPGLAPLVLPVGQVGNKWEKSAIEPRRQRHKSATRARQKRDADAKKARKITSKYY